MLHKLPRPPGAAQDAPEAWIERFAQPLAGRSDGPLAGLRFAVKDNIDVLGWPTTAACAAFAYQPREHATVVRKLLDAGASLVGKTNLDQFACGLSGTRSPYGAVPNAFAADHVAGGSSAGSAYVVATGQVDFALGTDTAGSGRVPAGLNNIVGIKPSKGLLSAHGVLPAAQSVDCVSIFARTVALAARVLQVAQGPDAQDPYSRKLQLAGAPFGGGGDRGGFRFGVPDTLEFFGDQAAQAAFAQAVDRLAALGGVAVTIDYAPLAQAAALLYESALVAERYAALRAFFDAHEDQVIEPVRSIIAQGRGYSAADLCAAQTQLRACAQRADAMWAGIDVLLLPTAPTHYPIAAMQADPLALNRNLGCYTNFVNLLDYAAIAVPSSIRADGLPFGVTLVGPCGSDWQLAELGQRYHHTSGLLQGALPLPLPEPQALAGIRDHGSDDDSNDAVPRMQIAVVGAHLSGLPLNGQLTERGARLLQATQTAPAYRLHALPGSVPAKPGLRRVAAGGAAIAIEVWDMPQSQIGGLLALIPQPLGLGRVELADGRWVTGFICEGHALGAAQDISEHGGWRAYLADLAARQSA